MNKKKINRSLKWLNILLLVINVSAISAFLVRTGGGKAEDKTETSSEIASLEFLKAELLLSDEQYQQAVILNERTFRTYHLLVDLICEANVGMLEELSKEDNDQHALDSIAKKVGNLNTSLKRETIRHFQNIRSICDEEQAVKLTLLFKEMMQLEEQCEICNKKECPRKVRIENLGKSF